MSAAGRQPSPPKRPRLSLKITTPQTSLTLNKSSTALKADIDMTSPTAFNTLSNAYAAAIELSSPKTSSGPKTAINTARPTSLRLVTNADATESFTYPSERTQTPGPFTIVYPDTPGTYSSTSTPVTAHPNSRTINTPVYTYTPPQSAHPSDEPMSNMFFFSSKMQEATPISPRTPRRRATVNGFVAPYTHPRSLHSILRNSPLPPRSAISPVSPARASQTIAERGSKRVGYNNPLCQTITNNKYIKSHIDLLAEEASPYSATDTEAENAETLDLTMAYAGDETRDGGQTPGPFEEMRRRMAGLGGESEAETSRSAARGSTSKSRNEKKRKWVWTIGTGEDEGGRSEQTPETAVQEPVTAIQENVTSTSEGSTQSPHNESLETLPPTVYTPQLETSLLRPGSAHSI